MTADGQFTLQIVSYPTEDGLVRRDIILERKTPDPTPDPFNGAPGWVANRFGLSFVTNPNRFETSTEIPLLRTALLALVDSTLQSRLIGDEK
jgi:hypothetical protein